MDIIAFFPIPKQLKKLLPTSSPDLDNVAKSVCDVLNIFINLHKKMQKNRNFELLVEGV